MAPQVEKVELLATVGVYARRSFSLDPRNSWGRQIGPGVCDCRVDQVALREQHRPAAGVRILLLPLLTQGRRRLAILSLGNQQAQPSGRVGTAAAKRHSGFRS